MEGLKQMPKAKCIVRRIDDPNFKTIYDNDIKMITDYAIRKSIEIIDKDPAGLFVYLCPPEYYQEPEVVKKLNVILFTSIRCFTIDRACQNILQYITLWDLEPNYVIMTKIVDEIHKVPDMGKCYFIDVIFYKKGQIYSTSLVNAQVHFHIYVSDVIPDKYPIMVTYRFEGHKRVYYALGSMRAVSMNFQKCLLESIWEQKAQLIAEKQSPKPATKNRYYTKHNHPEPFTSDENSEYE